jgi:predicted DNA-binding ribbon-helix-helix protein
MIAGTKEKGTQSSNLAVEIRILCQQMLEMHQQIQIVEGMPANASNATTMISC